MNKKQIFLYLGVGILLMLLLGIVYSYGMFKPEIESIYNVNKLQSGIPYMVALFFFSLFMAVGGMLYSKFNTKLVATFGVISIVLGFVLASFSDSVFQITLSYGVLVGTGVGILYGLPLRIIAQLDYPRLGLLTGITLLGFGMSPLVFAPIVNLFIQLFGMYSTFRYLAFIFLICMIPLVSTLALKDHLPKEVKRMNFAILKNKDFQSLYVLFFIGTFIGLTFIGFTVDIGEGLVGLNQNTLALLVGTFAVFNGIGRPLFGYIHDHQGFRISATLSYVLLISFTLVSYFFISNTAVFIVSFIVFYLNFGGWLSLAPSATRELFGKENYSKNFGLLYTAYGVGALFGNSVSGVLADTIGLRSIFLLMCSIAIVGLLYLNIAFKNYQKE